MSIDDIITDVLCHKRLYENTVGECGIPSAQQFKNMQYLRRQWQRNPHSRDAMLRARGGVDERAGWTEHGTMWQHVIDSQLYDTIGLMNRDICRRMAAACQQRADAKKTARQKRKGGNKKSRRTRGSI